MMFQHKSSKPFDFDVFTQRDKMIDDFSGTSSVLIVTVEFW